MPVLIQGLALNRHTNVSVNPGSGFEQAYKCDSVNPVNMIPIPNPSSHIEWEMGYCGKVKLAILWNR
jgi:hypothetical protein